MVIISEDADPLIAKYFGIVSSVCFALQYLPQTYLNFKRKSVKGFSTHGIVIKLFGASFLLVNSYLNGDGNFLHWLFFPAIPYLIGKFIPETLLFTNTIKPITQILSHLPQLKVCYDLKTTSGVSLFSQHFNIIGGLLGIYMCTIIPPVSNMTYMIYANSIFQAISLYALAFYYDFYLASHKKMKHLPQTSGDSALFKN